MLEVGPEIKTDICLYFKTLNKIIKSSFRSSECCLRMFLVPAWIISLLTVLDGFSDIFYPAAKCN